MHADDNEKPSSHPTEVRLTDETIAYIKEKMTEAVREGLRTSLTDKEALSAFWGVAFETLQEQATNKAGQVVLGGLGAAVKRLAMFVALGLIVYTLGGWAAVAKLWHSITAG